MSPVSAVLYVVAEVVSPGAAPQSAILVVFPGALRVLSAPECEGQLAQSPVLSGALRLQALSHRPDPDIYAL